MFVYHLMHRLMSAVPIANSIMASLSASDLSAFLFALGIELSNEMKQKYLNPIRDMPEHQDWVTERIVHGDVVMLVGKDVETLMGRIKDPQNPEHRRSRPYKMEIWLAVAPRVAFTDNSAFSGVNVGLNSVEDPEGKLNVQVLTGSIEDLRKKPHLFLMKTAFYQPPPDMWLTRARNTVWYTPTIPNENGIQVMFYIERWGQGRAIDAVVGPLDFIRKFGSTDQTTYSRIYPRLIKFSIEYGSQCEMTTPFVRLDMDTQKVRTAYGIPANRPIEYSISLVVTVNLTLIGYVILPVEL